jgi:Zn-dependent M28 family amino/carboxypeptidase
VTVDAASALLFTRNIIAETVGGSSDSVVLVGSHLDSVDAGPGINDNGSGSATNLALALAVSKSTVPLVNKLRFAWWSAEELGLVGSRVYAGLLSPAQVDDIVLNINIDMLASPNYVRFLLNGSDFNAPSGKLTQLFQDHFDALGLTYDFFPADGRSDYAPFMDLGITVAALATGAEGLKTIDQRQRFGGLIRIPYDPCYHEFCDDIYNLNELVLAQNAAALAAVTERLATKSNLRAFLDPSNQRRRATARVQHEARQAHEKAHIARSELHARTAKTRPAALGEGLPHHPNSNHFALA